MGTVDCNDPLGSVSSSVDLSLEPSLDPLLDLNLDPSLNSSLEQIVLQDLGVETFQNYIIHGDNAAPIDNNRDTRDFANPIPDTAALGTYHVSTKVDPISGIPQLTMELVPSPPSPSPSPSTTTTPSTSPPPSSDAFGEIGGDLREGTVDCNDPLGSG